MGHLPPPSNIEDRFGRLRHLLFYLACGAVVGALVALVMRSAEGGRREVAYNPS